MGISLLLADEPNKRCGANNMGVCPSRAQIEYGGFLIRTGGLKPKLHVYKTTLYKQIP